MIHNSIQTKVPYQEQISYKKPLEKLNMMDAFLFDASTEDPEAAVKIARTIVKRVTGHELKEFTLENQKQLLGIDLGKRGIRMDLWVREIDDENKEKPIVRLYDIEPNIYEDHLPKRSRFYQAKVDVKELSTGEKFATLPELVMIWILPYDPFGDDRMIYTVKNTVVENNELVYNDGVLKLFLFTGGKKGGSEELKAFLKYFEETTQDNAVDEDLQEIQKIVGTIKQNRETGDRYMTLQELIDYEKRDSYNDGMRQGIQVIIATCRSLGATQEYIKAEIMKHFSLTEETAAEYINRYWQENE